MNASVTELRPRTLASLRGAFIRDLIHDYGLTGNVVADRAGISRSTFASRLRGATAFLADEIEMIAGPMRVDPDALYAAYRSVTLDDPDGDRSLFLDLPSEPPSVTV
jgi:transcriptional regulator with XRE-family HTH domain